MTDLLRQTASMLASVPNALIVSDDHALRLADISSAMTLCALYLEDFKATADVNAARKFATKIQVVSKALTAIAKEVTDRDVLEALLIGNMACTQAHKNYGAFLRALTA